MMFIMIKLSVLVIVILTIMRCQGEENATNQMNSRPAIISSDSEHDQSKERKGPSEQLKRDLSGDAVLESTLTYPDTRTSHVTSYRVPRNNDYSSPQQVFIKTGKIRPGQYADKLGKRKTTNWKIPDFLKSAISPSDSKVSWSYWETDDSEYWPDDADDTKATTEAPATTTTTTTTTTTPAPTTKAEKVPVAIHKHFHYFKKAAPWKGAMPMPPPEEMMKMTEEMMKEMMKEMMMPDAMPTWAPEKKGLSGVWLKLSAVDPVTVLVAGIIPASLILAAALPSVMNKMMNANKGDPTMMPPMMPMVTTTAMGSGDTMGSRQHQESSSMSQVLQAAGDFGLQALRDPKCARKKFCQFARQSLISETPEFQRALRIATVAMQGSWLDVLGVRDILQSLSQGTCNEEDCLSSKEPFEVYSGTTQPTVVKI